MAEDKPKPRRLKRKVKTVRELAASSAKPVKSGRLRRSASAVSSPFRRLRRTSPKKADEVPKTKAGRLFKRRPRLIPRYFSEAWRELKKVTWPTRKETRQLTIAVFIFAIVFGILITTIDYGLDKIFKKVLLR